MTLDRAIAAKVVAYGNGWVDPEGFARCAESGTIYTQAQYLIPNTPVSFFAIGQGDENIVLGMVEEFNGACGLVLALPYNAVSHDMLSLLSTIEKRWRKEHTKKENKPLEGIYELMVVADIGMDAKTRTTKYICFSYSVEEIRKVIMEELQIKGAESAIDFESLPAPTMQDTLKQHFVKMVGRSDTGWTLEEIEEFSKDKKWLPREKS